MTEQKKEVYTAKFEADSNSLRSTETGEVLPVVIRNKVFPDGEAVEVSKVAAVKLFNNPFFTVTGLKKADQPEPVPTYEDAGADW